LKFWKFSTRAIYRNLVALSNAFWVLWNPPYGYVLLFFVYRPLRRVMPHSMATYLAFLVSGFLLHDVLFNGDWRLLLGQREIPEVTPLFGIFGALALLSGRLGIDLSARPARVRTAANLAWFAVGYALRSLLLTELRT
jgi:hypothetical protein